MESSKFSLKFFLQKPDAVRADRLVPIFHSWIQMHALADHLLIDVADYDHVHRGPGIALISHEANYYLDEIGGKKGLTYQHKQPIDAKLSYKLRKIFRWTLDACLLLEQSPALSGVAFRTDQVQLRIHDRLHGPNDPQTFVAIKLELLKVAQQLFGSDVQVEQTKNSPQEMFEVTIKSKQSPSVAELLNRLTSMTTPAGSALDPGSNI
ncbi:MAG TPA: hypothetical protein VKK61_00445 [Tepidisphaeraceae bacterium]|nr:hypothetical protein [Tepidisphaeraceae bacterium]